MSYPERPRSSAWYLVPILFGIIGGVIAFLYLRNKDPPKAKNCIYIGFAMMIIGIIVNILLASSVPGFDSGFNVNL